MASLESEVEEVVGRILGRSPAEPDRVISAIGPYKGGLRFHPSVNVLYAPGKAANAGGVAVSGLEMTQDAERLSWSAEQVDARLRSLMSALHAQVRAAAADYGLDGNYVAGANIAGFVRVADALLDESTL